MYVGPLFFQGLTCTQPYKVALEQPHSLGSLDRSSERFSFLMPPERPQEDMPTTREGTTHKVHIGGQAGYITMNKHEDGTLREVFVHGFGKVGSSTQGWTDSFAIMLSLWLQKEHEIASLAKRFAYLRFEPNGETDNPEIPTCHSIPHYILRLLAQRFGDEQLNKELDEIDQEMRRV